MRVVSLFAGIGGFDLGFERAGAKTVATVEIDAHCRKLLADKWPDAVHLDDVRTAGRHNLPECDVITFGFPCQDLSVAGKRAGLKGKRSGLFYEAMRIVDELKPAWAVWENVPGLLSSDNGRDLARVLFRLGESGYFGCVRCIDAQWLGVAQRRRRLFGVFTRLDSGADRAAEVLSVAESLRGHPTPSREAGKGVTSDVGSGSKVGHWDGGDCHPSLTQALKGSGGIGACNQELFSQRGGGLVPDICGCLSDGAHNGGGLNGQDAYTGRIIPVQTYDMRGNGDGETVGTLTGDHVGRPTDYTPVVCCSAEITGPLVSGHSPKGHGCAGVNGQDAHNDMLVPVAQVQWASGGGKVYNPVAQALRSGAEHNYQFAQVGMRVRRLTPTECERLQGFPDGWTAGFADSVRYRMLGNAVCVNVAEWVAKRLVKATTKKGNT
jgi:DNA (cytosine-5)-methyltransferase 1